MKLYYAPGACSLGIHVLLEEIGKPFEISPLKMIDGEHLKAPFTTINPKSKVPTLELDDGSILTEFPAIAWYLARTNPETNLIPTDIEGEARALEVIDYVVATIHMRGFARILRHAAFSPNPDDAAKVKQTGQEIVANGFKILEPALGDKDYILGEYSIADIALFYVEYWAGKRDVAPLPPPFSGHLQRMLARPAVQRALAAEGLA